MATAASSKKPKAMAKKNLQHFEKRLMEERKRVLKELGHFDETFGTTPQGADGDLSSYSFEKLREDHEFVAITELEKCGTFIDRLITHCSR